MSTNNGGLTISVDHSTPSKSRFNSNSLRSSEDLTWEFLDGVALVGKGTRSVSKHCYNVNTTSEKIHWRPHPIVITFPLPCNLQSERYVFDKISIRDYRKTTKPRMIDPNV